VITETLAKPNSPVDPLPVGNVVLVTPDLAAEYLTNNTHNRNLRENAVKAYAADMAAGDWRWTAEPVRFGLDGKLQDGQHRLHAIIKAGVAVPMLVVTGLDSAAQENVDGGIPRQLSDVLKLRGESHCHELAAITRLASRWDSGQRRSVSTSNGESNALLLRFLENHPELRGYTVAAVASVSKSVGVPKSIIGFTWWLFDRIDVEDANHFFTRLGEDTGHEKGQPIYELRRTLQQEQANARGERSRTWMIAVTIKAWNAFRDGREVGMYRWRPGGANPDKFPEPA